jgi:O-antigen/teichoic acid export membrane protein
MSTTGEATDLALTGSASEHPRATPASAGRGSGAREQTALPSGSSLARAVGSNTVAQLAAHVATLATTLVTSALLSRYLGPAGFGQYALIFAYVGLVAAFFADIGLAQIAARDASQSPDEAAEILASAATLQVGASVVAYLALIAMTQFLIGAPERVGVAVASALVLLLPLDILAVALQVKLQLARLAWIAIVVALVRLALIGGAVMAGASLTALIILGTVAGALRYALFPFVLRDALAWHQLRPNRRRYRGLLTEAVPLALATSCVTVMSQLPVVLLNWLSSPEEVGFFSAAWRIAANAGIPSVMLATTLYPLFSGLAETDRPRFAHLVGQVLRFTTLAAMPIAVSGLILGPSLMRLLYGEAFGPASPAFGILMAQAAIIVPSTIVAHALIATGQQRMVLASVGSGAVVTIAICMATGRQFGAVGAASGLLAGSLAACIYLLVGLRRALGLQLQVRAGSLIGVGLALTAGTAVAAAALPLPAAAALGLGAGIGAVFALGAIDRADVQLLRDAIRVRRESADV